MSRRRLAAALGIERRRDSWVLLFCAVSSVAAGVLLVVIG